MSGPFIVGDISPNRYFLVGAAAMGLLFSVIVPTDGTIVEFLISLLKWQFQTLIPVVLIILVTKWLSGNGVLSRLGTLTGFLVCGLCGAILFSPVATFIDLYLFAEAESSAFLFEWIDELASITIPISLGWLVLNLPFIAGYQLRLSMEDPVDDELSELPDAEFVDLLPAELRAPILMLQSQLHYLQVVTEKGSALILYNLSDAISQLPDGLGLQPHRSYWVNRHFVDSVRRQGRQAIITLTNGTEVPVSRRLVKSVVSKLERI